MAIRVFLIAIIAVPAFGQTVEKIDYTQLEIQPSCVWNHEKARCFIQNRQSKPITCEINIAGTTFDGRSLDNTRRVIVQPSMVEYGEDLIANNGSILRNVKAHAVCL